MYVKKVDETWDYLYGDGGVFEPPSKESSKSRKCLHHLNLRGKVSVKDIHSIRRAERLTLGSLEFDKASNIELLTLALSQAPHLQALDLEYATSDHPEQVEALAKALFNCVRLKHLRLSFFLSPMYFDTRLLKRNPYHLLEVMNKCNKVLSSIETLCISDYGQNGCFMLQQAQRLFPCVKVLYIPTMIYGRYTDFLIHAILDGPWLDSVESLSLSQLSWGGFYSESLNRTLPRKLKHLSLDYSIPFEPELMRSLCKNLLTLRCFWDTRMIQTIAKLCPGFPTHIDTSLSDGCFRGYHSQDRVYESVYLDVPSTTVWCTPYMSIPIRGSGRLPCQFKRWRNSETLCGIYFFIVYLNRLRQDPERACLPQDLVRLLKDYLLLP